jgi:hypothetical protein
MALHEKAPLKNHGERSGAPKTEKAARSGQPFHHPRYIELRDRA